MLLNVTLSAQDMYEVGATWYFNIQELRQFPANGYEKYEIVGDTILAEKVAKIVAVDRVYYDGRTEDWSDEYIYEVNEKVYFWNDSTFELMYDFNLNVGDTLDVSIENYHCDSVTPLIVVSISVINVNGKELTIQDVSSTIYIKDIYGGSDENYNFRIIENVGIANSFIFDPACIVDDNFAYIGLRCYTDSQVTYKSEWWQRWYSEAACDSLINDPTTGIEYISSESNISLYPNPAGDIINISTDVAIGEIIVYSLLGKQLDHLIIIERNPTINLETYTNGIYFLNILLTDGKTFNLKFQKI